MHKLSKTRRLEVLTSHLNVILKLTSSSFRIFQLRAVFLNVLNVLQKDFSQNLVKCTHRFENTIFSRA